MYINEGYKAGVFLCSPTNSTMFTECCETAICNDETKCPKCKRNVIGDDADSDHKRGMIRWNYAYKGPRHGV